MWGRSLFHWNYVHKWVNHGFAGTNLTPVLEFGDCGVPFQYHYSQIYFSQRDSTSAFYTFFVFFVSRGVVLSAGCGCVRVCSTTGYNTSGFRGPSLQTLNLSGGVGFIARRLRHPKMWNADGAQGIFGTACGLRPCDKTLLKKALCHIRKINTALIRNPLVGLIELSNNQLWFIIIISYLKPYNYE